MPATPKTFRGIFRPNNDAFVAPDWMPLLYVVAVIALGLVLVGVALFGPRRAPAPSGATGAPGLADVAPTGAPALSAPISVVDTSGRVVSVDPQALDQARRGVLAEFTGDTTGLRLLPGTSLAPAATASASPVVLSAVLLSDTPRDKRLRLTVDPGSGAGTQDLTAHVQLLSGGLWAFSAN
ncbi:MAG: hypothetical protein JO086_02570 [Acidimicrobiia bacterium]|nr:hypothetical protein [Acidimicrobiia bacterium]